MVLSKLHPGIEREIREFSRELSDIQRLTLEPLLAGENALILAPTASGKTEAMLWPMLSRIAQLRGDAPSATRMMVIAPLKALLNSLDERVQRWCAAAGLKAFKWHGDVAQSRKQLERLKPSDVLTTTPESFEVAMSHADGVARFANIEAIAVDETHYFAADSRGAQLVSLIERLCAATGRDIQRVGLSATVGNPEEVLDWLSGTSARVRRVRHAEPAVRATEIKVAAYADSADLDASIIDACANKRALVFVKTRGNAESVGGLFDVHNGEHPRDSIAFHVHHSSVAKGHREEAERLIKLEGAEGIRTIISTSTLELGIDIGHLDTTLQIGPPRSVSSYLQRLGRTGRRAGTKRSMHVKLNDWGTTSRQADVAETEMLLTLAILRLGQRGVVEACKPSRSDFALLVQQILCLSLERSGITTNAAWDVLHCAPPFAEVTRDELNALVDHMLKTQLLRGADEVFVFGPRAEKVFGANRRELYAVFSSETEFTVKHGKHDVGTLHATYARTKPVPFALMLAGHKWMVVERDLTHRVLIVQPSKAGQAPHWTHKSAGFQVTRLVANEVRTLLRDGVVPTDVTLDARAQQVLERARCSRVGFEGDLQIERISEGAMCIHTYAGDRNNWLLARYLEKRVASLASNEENFEHIVMTGPPGAMDAARADVLLAVSELERLSSDASDRLSQEFAAMMEPSTRTKFDELVPPTLRAKEVARGFGNLQHIRYLTGKSASPAEHSVPSMQSRRIGPSNA